jgi:hypothetical protein
MPEQMVRHLRPALESLMQTGRRLATPTDGARGCCHRPPPRPSALVWSQVDPSGQRRRRWRKLLSP